VTRRLIAACVLSAGLALPAVAAAQQDPNPATTAPAQTSAPTTPATTPGATAPATTPGATAPATTPPATAPATTPPAQTTSTAPAAAEPTVRSGDDRAAVILLLMVGALVLLGLALWAVAQWQAWEPDWLARWRHAAGEAGWRAGNAWAEFTDWLRLGR
jgi:hypothetical protein